jgi:hypothetical protein
MSDHSDKDHIIEIEHGPLSHKGNVEAFKHRNEHKYEESDKLTPFDRKYAIFKSIVWIIIDALWLGIYYGLTKQSDEESDECSHDMTVWLYVMGATHGAFFIYHLILLGTVGFSPCCRKSGRNFLEHIYWLLLCGFYMAWLVYGNTFVYDTDIYACKTEDTAADMYRLFLAAILYGYIFWLV